MKHTRNTALYILILLTAQLTGFVYNLSTPGRLLKGVLLLFLILIALTVAALLMIRIKNGDRRKDSPGEEASDVCFILTAFIFAAAFLIKAEYIIYTPTWIRQHDVIGFGSGEGQAGFIEYFYEKLRLIDFDPRKKWGFFQPPLHHMLAALWLHLQRFIGSFFGWSMDQCRENVQVLTLIYSSLTAWFGIRIMKKLRLPAPAMLTAAMLVSAHPCFIQMSGSINNDMLCILLQVMGMYFFMEWMEIPGADLRRQTACMAASALCMGLSMMAKLSGIMLSVPMGAIMLYRLISSVRQYREGNSEGRGGPLSLISQYAVFALISIPIGIWSPVRNYIRFGVPLMYTPKVGEPIEGVSGLQRIFYPGSEATPYTCMVSGGHAYDEFNIPLAILKTSLFGEADLSQVHPLATGAAWIMLVTGGLIAISVAVCAVILALRYFGRGAGWRERERGVDTKPLAEDGTEREWFVFMVIYILFSLLFLVRLCFKIPNFSSQDFRYIAHIIVPSAGLLGLYMKYAPGVSRDLIFILTACFTAASLFEYFLAGAVIW